MSGRYGEEMLAEDMDNELIHAELSLFRRTSVESLPQEENFDYQGGMDLGEEPADFGKIGASLSEGSGVRSRSSSRSLYIKQPDSESGESGTTSHGVHPPVPFRKRETKVKISKPYKRRVTDKKLLTVMKGLDSKDLERFLDAYIFGSPGEAREAAETTRLDESSLCLARCFLGKRLFKCSELSAKVKQQLASETKESRFKDLALRYRPAMRHQKTSNTTRAVFPRIIVFLCRETGKFDALRMPDHDALNTKQYIPILRRFGLLDAFYKLIDSPKLREFIIEQSRISFKANFSIWASKLSMNSENVIRMGVIPNDFDLAVQAFLRLRGGEQ